MKFKLTSIFIGIAMLCSFWLFGYEKIQEVFLRNSVPELSYLNEELLDSNNSQTALASALSPFYSENFEELRDWTFVHSDVNNWYIGEAANNGGKKSLYVSDDKGVSNNYSPAKSNDGDVSYALSPAFTVPAGTTNSIVSFDWRSMGEGSEWYVSDAFSVWLVPATYTPTKNLPIAPASSGGILVKENLYGKKEFVKENIKLNLEKFAGTSIKIVFQWICDPWTMYQPPAAIDNISIYQETCQVPSGLKMSEIQLDEARATWIAPNASVENFELFLGEEATYPKDNAVVEKISSSLNHTFTNLKSSTYYYVWYRSVCSATDKSYWVGPVKFMTLCGNDFTTPFYETFDTDSPNVECWTLLDMNPKNTDKLQLSTNYKMEGDRGLFFNSYNAVIQHNSYAITPTFDFDGGIYKLTYYYKTSSSYTNNFEVLLSNSGGINPEDFTEVLVPGRTYQASNFVKETVFIDGFSGKVSIAWHINEVGNTSFYLENVRIEKVICTEPLRLKISDVRMNSAAFTWDDDISTEWEYAVVKEGDGAPSADGTKVSQNKTVAALDVLGQPLTSDTNYDFYVRSKCTDGTFGEWVGPLSFKTACDPITPPYFEGFNTKDSKLKCWTILDVNKDGTTYGNIWQQSQWTLYEGDRCMYYSGSSPVNDDWLISPGFTLDGKLYAVIFYYQLDQNTKADLQVKLSVNGTDPSAFTETLATTLPYKGAFYTKKVVYVEGVTGVANIGFHVGATRGSMQIDAFEIREVDCRAPEDLLIVEAGTTTIDFSWTDNTNERWEYYVELDDGMDTPPTGSGSLSLENKAKAIIDNSLKTSIEPNQEYKVYVRSTCGNGKYSEWVGPVRVRTGCEVMPIPYQEGFNSDSQTQYCWKIVDGNGDKPWYGGFGEWFATDQQAYEGNQSMYFTNLNDNKNDDWLMSPLFNFEKDKVYRVTYMYRTEPESKAEFSVKLSNTGREKENFTHTLLPHKEYDNVPWKKHKFLLSGTDYEGEVSIAFHVSNFENWGSNVYIDDFIIEDVTGCTEPLVQGVDTITGTSAEIFWDNDFGTTGWEYFVRKKATLVAPPITKGTDTNSNRVTVTKDNFGGDIEGNTWYEFYVRTNCSEGKKSEWTGPFYFRTRCTYSTLPYWEGFNGDDNSLRCWTMLNESGGATGWRQSTSAMFEGSHSMAFVQSKAEESNDWFISPLIKGFDATKTYRVKFNYRGTGTGTNEMEVLASTGGSLPADFTEVIAPSKSYSSAGVFKDGINYFTGLSGDMYFAFHVLGEGSKNIIIDNLFIDELTTCGQPLDLDVKDVKETSVNLLWKDAFNAKKWQYMIQETKQIAPTAADAGVPVSSNDFVVTKDINGNDLKQNTDYVYYVRTDCENGKFSDWSGPFAFTTVCGIYTVPFTANFNSDTKQNRCWSMVKFGDKSGSWRTNDLYAYEGDGLMEFKQTGKDALADGYLISPAITFVAGKNYVLKYYYNTDLRNYNEFEVLLSTAGTDVSNFTTTLVNKKAYNNANYIEEVVFISGVSGNVNIAWHTTTEGPMALGIDYVTIEEAGVCPEPSNVTVTDFTENTIDVEWTQTQGITSWEVYVVEYGMPIPTGASGAVVTGTPRYKATGLTSGKAYYIYVRAKCAGGSDWSNWSTPANGPTKVSTNEDCSGAMTIPVNTTAECAKMLPVSTVGSSEIDESDTFYNCASWVTPNELWFEFTAIATSHLISFKDMKDLNAIGYPAIAFQVFEGNCNNLVYSDCEKFDSYYGTPSKDDMSYTMNLLTPGTKYYVRVMIPEGDYLFNICITTNEFNYVYVSKQGEDYTTDELVRNVLIQAGCDLVSNVVYKSGPNLGGNSLGYFNKNGSIFPFEEGIVLATHDIATTPGPYHDYGDAGGWRGVRGMIEPWEGDEDLNAVIASVGGNVYGGTKSVSTLEFDFVPIKDTIKFEYLMASESYLHKCTVVCWGAGSLFTAWLTELETGQGQNLALVPGTSNPISLSTIRDTDRSGADCDNVSPEFFGNYFGNGQDNPLTAPVNYIGMTKPMSSEPVKVIPGKKYRIKLAMADYCNTNHVSAVFFNARSFELGELDLGADLTVEANTAICSYGSKTIHSGLMGEGLEISWLKDGEVIPGENGVDLEISESGEYRVIGRYPAINCEVTGSIKAEMFQPLNEIIHEAKSIEYCRYSLEDIVVDLTLSEESMLAGLDASRYKLSYYLTKEDAEAAVNSIEVPSSHKIEPHDDLQKRYIVVEDLLTGCSEVFTVDFISVRGDLPEKPDDVKVCTFYEFPEGASNLSYFSGPAATGVEYFSGDRLSKLGVNVIYIVQDNGNGCYEETSYEVEIVSDVTADVFPDKTHYCDRHILEKLSAGNRYFSEPNGKGVEYFAGDEILETNKTIYVYVESEYGLCYDESSYVVTYEDCPIQKGVSPNGDGLNDFFDLSSNNASSVKVYNRLGTLVYEFKGQYTSQWYGQNKDDKLLPSGTYFYVVEARGKVLTGWVQVIY